MESLVGVRVHISYCLFFRAVSELCEERKDSLEKLYLDGEGLTDLAVFSVSHCRNLRFLSISFCETFTESSLDYLKVIHTILEYCKVPCINPGLIGILVNYWAALYSTGAFIRGHFEVSCI